MTNIRVFRPFLQHLFLCFFYFVCTSAPGSTVEILADDPRGNSVRQDKAQGEGLFFLACKLECLPV